MKRLFSSARLFMIAGLGVLSTGMLLTSCLKDDDSFNNDDTAGIMAFNLAQGQPAVGFAIDGNIFTQAPLAYNNFTGVYLPVFAGARSVEAFSFNSGDTLATASNSFAPGKYYSVFLVGSGSNLSNVIVQDNFDSLSSSGSAYIRYINAVEDGSSPTVTIATGSTNVVNDVASFKSVSAFKAIAAGSAQISVSNGGSINATRTITLEARKVYTVLLIGKAGGTGDDAVQIKFVANGQLDENATKSNSVANRSAN